MSETFLEVSSVSLSEREKEEQRDGVRNEGRLQLCSEAFHTLSRFLFLRLRII